MKLGVLVCAYRRISELSIILNSNSLNIFPLIIVSFDKPSESTTENEFLRLKQMQVIANSRYADRIVVREAQSHLGLHDAVRGALDFAFEKVDYCLVLEEDCIPSDFLGEYIEKILKLDSTLLQKSHFCLSRHVPTVSSELSKTKYPFVWGWFASETTWRKNRILAHEIDPDEFRFNLATLEGSNRPFFNYWMNMFYACREISLARINDDLGNLNKSNGFISWAANSWATPYTLAHWMGGSTSFSVRPPFNLIENVGFGDLATHTRVRPLHARRLDAPRAFSTNFEIRKYELDLWEDVHIFGIQNQMKVRP